ncbi:hypothetical protein TNCV_1751521 [Trichonephila clavipes]|nr:hypothetical protein TNCV_1751521 [Trichonephila clavipes]
MPRASTKVFKKRRGVFNKGRCNKSNDGCGESTCAFADGAKKLCTNETSAREKLLHLSESNCGEAVKFHCPSCKYNYTFFNSKNAIVLRITTEYPASATRETCMAEAVCEAVDENDGKRDLAIAVDGSWQKRGFLRRMAW